ncbi:unnamed protein product [Cylicocyclus nassatus]|uniref:Uncharacterized protein n=1 Tax=Cylicocyclus nassatus TaxID=53992 RepID=A0AA36H569_CYLNA|nr:unnamed protein product [Cylicocyclus nassatus]
MTSILFTTVLCTAIQPILSQILGNGLNGALPIANGGNGGSQTCCCCTIQQQPQPMVTAAAPIVQQPIVARPVVLNTCCPCPQTQPQPQPLPAPAPSVPEIKNIFVHMPVQTTTRRPTNIYIHLPNRGVGGVGRGGPGMPMPLPIPFPIGGGGIGGQYQFLQPGTYYSGASATTATPIGVPDIVRGPCGETIIPLYNPPSSK